MCRKDNNRTCHVKLLQLTLNDASQCDQKRARIDEQKAFIRLRDGVVALGERRCYALNWLPGKIPEFLKVSK